MSWFVFAFLSGASDILYNFATRNSLKNSSKSLEFSWAMTTLRSAIFLPAIFELTNSSLSFRHFVLLFGLGAITVINILIFMKMHSLNELSISAIIVRLRTVWVPLVALVLIGERLVFTEYLGIFITFLAVAVISSPRRIVKDKAMSVALLFSITGSILGVAMKAASEIFSPNLIVLAMTLPSAVVLPLFAKDKEKSS